jgi:hypothetical protein
MLIPTDRPVCGGGSACWDGSRDTTSLFRRPTRARSADRRDAVPSGLRFSIMSTLVRRLATAAVGTSIGVGFAVSGRRSALERDGYPPVTHPGCPEYLLPDTELQAVSSAPPPQAASMSGLWLAWYNGPLVLRLFGKPDGTLAATHLTGSVAVPAGRPAFDVCFDPPAGLTHGTHSGSLLPGGMWMSSAPCRANFYCRDLSRRSADTSTLSVDIFVLSWLPPVRVPMRRVPEADVYIEKDAAGHVLPGSSGLRAAQAAVAQARFDEIATGGQ